MKFITLTMKKYLFLLTIFFLAACGGSTEPTAVPQPTAEIAAAPEVTAEPTDTTVPQAAPTEAPITNTLVPEPPTATAPPTATSDTEVEPTAADTEDTEETAVPEADPTETAIETTEAAPEPTSETTAEPTTASQPPPAEDPGEVPPVVSNEYPDNNDKSGWENRINVPAGFDVTYLGRVEGHPTSMDFGPDGLLYIANQEGSIFTMDSSGNVNTFASGYNTPTGIAFRPGTNQLYISDRLINENVGGEAQISIVGQGQVVGGLPCCYTFLHAAHGIAFGPDGMGYVGVGGRADHGEILDGSGRQDELHPLEASILRFNPDNGELSVYARGFRNPYDIAWDANGALWVTDNAPDYGPPEEVHRVVPGAEHGYPWYDCDTCFSPPPGVAVLPPTYTFVSHASPTGITVYKASQFPANYYNNKFVALWSAFPGAQKVMRLADGPPQNFATGFAAPIEVIVGPDGSMYVGDWATGIIFKISYTG